MRSLGGAGIWGRGGQNAREGMQESCLILPTPILYLLSLKRATRALRFRRCVAPGHAVQGLASFLTTNVALLGVRRLGDQIWELIDELQKHFRKSDEL
jgi:hypothetical protein